MKELAIITKEKFDHEDYRFSGFFQFCFGSHEEGGYYHENPLQFGESGNELIDYWFTTLLDIIILLEIDETDYVAFKEIETTKKWIEFKKYGHSIILNIGIDSNNELSDLLITIPFNNFTYIEPRNIVIEFKEFRNEILKSANGFLKRIAELNSELCKTKRIKEIINKIEHIQNHVQKHILAKVCEAVSLQVMQIRK